MVATSFTRSPGTCRLELAVWNLGYLSVALAGIRVPPPLRTWRPPGPSSPRCSGPTPGPPRPPLPGRPFRRRAPRVRGPHRAPSNSPLPSPRWGSSCLAPLLDLAAVHAANLGDGAVELFLGGHPPTCARGPVCRARSRSSALGIPPDIIHRRWRCDRPRAIQSGLQRVRSLAWDDIRYDILPGLDDMAFLDPASAAHQHRFPRYRRPRTSR